VHASASALPAHAGRGAERAGALPPSSRDLDDGRVGLRPTRAAERRGLARGRSQLQTVNEMTMVGWSKVVTALVSPDPTVVDGSTFLRERFAQTDGSTPAWPLSRAV
jgi:hypothetical protein